MSTTAFSLRLSFVASAALVSLAAACGPSPSTEVAPQPTGTATAESPSTGTSTTATPDPTAAPTAAPTASPNGAGHVEPGHAEAAKKASTPLAPSTLLAEVKAAGVPLDKPFDKLSMGQKKKVMPFFVKALGFKDCTGCHAPGKDTPIDPTIETADTKMAEAMWDHFVVPMRAEDKSGIFCDSCHVGSEHVLARSDREALEKFMEDEYEHKLTRADGKENSCTTCHGDPFEPKIFTKLWKLGH